jgi:tubulin polyglutamylase TTLL1/tubulin monoglycylase TTLL3/8
MFPDQGIDIVKHIVPQMKKIIVDTFKASCFKIDPSRLHNSFEILGYDFMMDSDFKLSLIEVNTNPCLETESPLMTRIISELVESTIKLVIDPLFPNPDLN